MKYFWLFAFTLLFVGCATKDEDQIIGKEKFAEVLTAIHLADATLAVSDLQVNRDTTAIEYYYNDVLVKYGVTQRQIENSFKYYATKPRQFEKIYETVSENLAKMESEFNEKQKEEKEKE